MGRGVRAAVKYTGRRTSFAPGLIAPSAIRNGAARSIHSRGRRHPVPVDVMAAAKEAGIVVATVAGSSKTRSALEPTVLVVRL